MPAITIKAQKMPPIRVVASAKRTTVNAGLIPVSKFMGALLPDKMIPGTGATQERAASSKRSFSDIVKIAVCTQIAGGTALGRLTQKQKRLCSIARMCDAGPKQQAPEYGKYPGRERK